MPSRDPSVDVLAPVLPVVTTEAAAANPAPSRSRSLVLGSVAGVAGIVVLLAGTTLLARSPMALRVALCAAGTYLCSWAIRLVASAVAQRKVDVALGLAVAWGALVVGAAVLAPVLPLGEHVDTSKTIDVPSYVRPDLLSDHPLGTNQFGLDLLARAIWGARVSLAAAALAIVVGTTIGGLLGLLAGFLKGRADQVIGILTNVGLAFPPLVLLLVLAGILGHHLVGVAAALSLLVVPGTIRFARANTLAVATRDHTFSAYILGASRRRIMVREVLPAVGAKLVSLAFLTMPYLIVAEASLSFLGLGIQPPAPTWGNMISEGNGGAFESNPHVVLVPGTVLLVTVVAFNVIGQRLQRRWDPRQEQV